MINNPKLINKVINQIKDISKQDLDEVMRLIEVEEDINMDVKEERMALRLTEAIENLVEDKSKEKVTFEFNNNHDANLVVNRYKMINSVSRLADYRRELEKYDVVGEIVVKDNKILSEEELKDYNLDCEGRKTYIEVEEVIRKLDDILDDVYWLIYNE